MSDRALGQHLIQSHRNSECTFCAVAEMYAKRLKAGKPIDEVILHAGGVHGGAKQEQMELLNCWRVAEWDIAWGNMHLAQVSRLFLPGCPSEKAPPPNMFGHGSKQEAGFLCHALTAESSNQWCFWNKMLVDRADCP